MKLGPTRLLPAVLAAAYLWAAAAQPATLPFAGRRELAPGIELLRLDGPGPLALPAPISIHLLKLNPARADLRVALATDRVPGAETVASLASRRGALAAVNGGFFDMRTGAPVGLLKIDGALVRTTSLPRGAVAIAREGGFRIELVFDRVSAGTRVRVGPGPRAPVIEVAGTNTVRLREKLMLFTPAYGERTGTAAGGVEWVLDGSPWRVRRKVAGGGNTEIPPRGAVLSFGGTKPPAGLRALRRGARVEVTVDFRTLEGSDPRAWSGAAHVMAGAGLLVRNGEPVIDWSPERLRAGFDTERHPRTMIGVDAEGFVWLVAADGRQPDLSVGLSFGELQALARGLHLVHALNLDGGGSTTMVVEGQVVNRPSDPTGPRPVSDALLVFSSVPH